MSKKKEEKDMTLLKYNRIILGIGLLGVLIGSFFVDANANKILSVALILIGILISIIYCYEDKKDQLNFIYISACFVLLVGPFMGTLKQVFFPKTIVVGLMYTNLFALLCPVVIILSVKNLFRI